MKSVVLLVLVGVVDTKYKIQLLWRIKQETKSSE